MAIEVIIQAVSPELGEHSFWTLESHDSVSTQVVETLSCDSKVQKECSPNSGDTAWMMTSMAIVLMMTVPGLALFYGGMVRKKNVGDTVMTSFAITCLISILWLFFTYSLAFREGGDVFGRDLGWFIGGIRPVRLAGPLWGCCPQKREAQFFASSAPQAVFFTFSNFLCRVSARAPLP